MNYLQGHILLDSSAYSFGWFIYRQGTALPLTADVQEFVGE